MWTARGREKAGNQTVEDELCGTIPNGVRVLVPVVALRVAGTLDSKRPYDGGPFGRSSSDAYLVITRLKR